MAKVNVLFLLLMKEKPNEQHEKKTRYQMVIDGEVEPEGEEKGWINLEHGRRSFNQMDAETLREISHKGGVAVQKLHGERKTARESLERILTLKISDGILEGADIPSDLAERLKRDNPNATLYDLIQMVAVGKAVGGNMKAYELIRDTHGDKPKDEVKIEGAELMTDNDRELLRTIAERVEGHEVIIAKDIEETGDE